MRKRLAGFPPVVDGSTRILILGSFPGEESLRKREYYGYGRNHFWRILSDLFGADLEGAGYDAKIRFLLKKKIGLWDTIRSCARAGSSDNMIRNAGLSDIAGILKRHPKIEVIFTNGRKAHGIVIKDKNIRVKVVYLPSTSPAHAIPYRRKKAAWAGILKFL